MRTQQVCAPPSCHFLGDHDPGSSLTPSQLLPARSRRSPGSPMANPMQVSLTRLPKGRGAHQPE